MGIEREPELWLAARLEEQEPELLRGMLVVLAEAVMGADADAICGAALGERAQTRTDRRNGYRTQKWETCAGAVSVSVPRLRKGTYSPDWLLADEEVGDRLTVEVAAACLYGPSPLRMERLLAGTPGERIKGERVAELAGLLASCWAEFRAREPEDGSPAEAKVEMVPFAESVVFVATGVDGAERQRLLSVEFSTTFEEAVWEGFVDRLEARGLKRQEPEKAAAAAPVARERSRRWSTCLMVLCFAMSVASVVALCTFMRSIGYTELVLLVLTFGLSFCAGLITWAKGARRDQGGRSLGVI
ncbi:transposase [Actinocorallia lasiicapitis]